MAEAYSLTPDSVAAHVLMLTLQKSPRNICRKIKAIKLFTFEPEVNRFGEYGPGESDFTPCADSEVNSPSATTLENNGKFRLIEQAENGLCRKVGGGNATAVEPSLAREVNLAAQHTVFGAI